MWEQHQEHTRLLDSYLCFRPLGKDSGVSGSQCSSLWNERKLEDRITSCLLVFGVCVAFHWVVPSPRGHLKSRWRTWASCSSNHPWLLGVSRVGDPHQAIHGFWWWAESGTLENVTLNLSLFHDKEQPTQRTKGIRPRPCQALFFPWADTRLSPVTPCRGLAMSLSFPWTFSVPCPFSCSRPRPRVAGGGTDENRIQGGVCLVTFTV